MSIFVQAIIAKMSRWNVLMKSFIYFKSYTWHQKFLPEFLHVCVCTLDSRNIKKQNQNKPFEKLRGMNSPLLLFKPRSFESKALSLYFAMQYAQKLNFSEPVFLPHPWLDLAVGLWRCNMYALFEAGGFYVFLNGNISFPQKITLWQVAFILYCFDWCTQQRQMLPHNAFDLLSVQSAFKYWELFVWGTATCKHVGAPEELCIAQVMVQGPGISGAKDSL